MKKKFTNVVHNYLRESHDFPHIWCPGCTHGTTMGCVINAIDALNMSKDDLYMVSGIGCSSRAPNYFDFNGIHSTHGKALAVATGVSLANPDKKVMVFTGDGDGSAIGGNHLIHAARRNIDITCVLFNNTIYGMTGGQYSPTTKKGCYGATAPYTAFEPTFDLCNLVLGAGGTYVARMAAITPRPLIKILKEAIQHKGFSFVEVLSYCPPVFGFYNRDTKPVNYYRRLKESLISIKKAEDLKKQGEPIPEGKVVTGVFRNETQESLHERYVRVCKEADTTPFSLHINTLDMPYPVDEE